MIFPPPPYEPFGVSYTEWTVKWWRWLMSIPKDKNPALDQMGKCSSIRQIEPNVWFLAGTLGGHASRKCTIPSGRAVLFPIINIEASNKDTNVSNEMELVSYTKRHIDNIDKNFLQVLLDGVPIQNIWEYRVSAPVFDVEFPNGNLLEVTSGPSRIATDGYWLFLRPLEPGYHTLNFSGACLAGKVQIGAKYFLKIR